MIKDITLGQYFPGNSILHRLDPRMKIVLVTAYIILLFFAQSALSYLLAAGVTFALMLLSGIPLKLYVRGLKPIVFIVIFTGIINMFYTSGNVLCSWWIFQITDLGIANAVRMILRIMLLVWGIFDADLYNIAGGFDKRVGKFAFSVKSVSYPSS